MRLLLKTSLRIKNSNNKQPKVPAKPKPQNIPTDMLLNAYISE